MRRQIVAAVVFSVLGWVDPAPAQPRDDDGDGVLDNEDACSATPTGLRPVARGCAAVELPKRTDLFARAALAALDAGSAAIASEEDIAKLAGRLGAARKKLVKALARFRRGDLCGGARGVRAGHAKIVNTDAALAKAIAKLTRKLLREPVDFPQPAPDADTTDADRQLAAFDTTRALLRDALAKLEEVPPLLDAACAAIVGPLKVRGRVFYVDDDNGALQLEDGRVVGLASKRRKPGIVAGQVVKLTGAAFADGSGLATAAAAVDAGFSPDAAQVGCLFLRIAPVQRFAPLFAGPYTYHNPSAYEVDIDPSDPDVGPELFLEQGMHLAVESGGCPGTSPSPPGPFTRYSAKLDLDYQDVNGARQTVTLADDLTPSDAGVAFPPDMNPTFGSTLTFTVLKQSCSVVALAGRAPPGPFDGVICQAPVELHTEKRLLSVHGNGFYCMAQYATTGFSVENGGLTTFAPATVTSIFTLPPLDSAASLAFDAEGYAIGFGGGSSYPSVLSIQEDEPFAIYDFDFFDPDGFFQPELTGVDHPSGLRWPRVLGQRGGRPFSYICTLPTIVRDLLDECPSPPDSFYKLPFEGGAPTWTMGQGNNGTFTHKGNSAFAFDFLAPASTDILAARRGTVIGIIETNSGNCFCGSCMPATCTGCSPPNANNRLIVRHEDGTLGRYFHFLPNSTFVNQGDKIVRGAPLADVGSVGCSSTTHVHFEVLGMPGGPTIKIRFESAVPGDETCYIPDTGDPIESTNQPPS